MKKHRLRRLRLPRILAIRKQIAALLFIVIGTILTALLSMLILLKPPRIYIPATRNSTRNPPSSCTLQRLPRPPNKQEGAAASRESAGKLAITARASAAARPNASKGEGAGGARGRGERYHLTPLERRRGTSATLGGAPQTSNRFLLLIAKQIYLIPERQITPVSLGKYAPICAARTRSYTK